MPAGGGAERGRPRVASMQFSGVREVAHASDASDASDTSDTAASWHTTADAARALGVSPSTVRRRIADGQLTARREPYRRSFRWLVLLPATPTPPATPAAAGPSVAEAHEAHEAHDTPDTRDTPDTERDRVALAVVREADAELRAIAAHVGLARRAVVAVLERERTVALRQATLLEELAGDPPAPVTARAAAGRTGEGSRRALLVGLLVCIAAAAGSALLALPAWSGGIVGALAVVAGLIATVEAYLVVTGWLGGLGRRDRGSA